MRFKVMAIPEIPTWVATNTTSYLPHNLYRSGVNMFCTEHIWCWEIIWKRNIVEKYNEHWKRKTNVVSFYKWKQESPPSWTQEVYRPRRIKYYSVGYPPVGVPPQPGLTRGGTPYWGTPLLGYLSPGQVWPGGTRGGVRVPPLARVPPGQVPPSQGTPHWGTPPWLDLGQVPPPSWTWLGYPPPRCEHTENITFRRTTYAVGNKVEVLSQMLWLWNASVSVSVSVLFL